MKKAAVTRPSLMMSTGSTNELRRTQSRRSKEVFRTEEVEVHRPDAGLSDRRDEDRDDRCDVGRGAAEPGGKARTDGEKYCRARHQHEEDGRREAGREVPQDAEEGVEEALARALARRPQ